MLYGQQGAGGRIAEPSVVPYKICCHLTSYIAE
jgi:hypothetical protein